jgi:hypothetical protein
MAGADRGDLDHADATLADTVGVAPLPDHGNGLADDLATVGRREPEAVGRLAEVLLDEFNAFDSSPLAPRAALHCLRKRLAALRGDHFVLRERFAVIERELIAALHRTALLDQQGQSARETIAALEGDVQSLRQSVAALEAQHQHDLKDIAEAARVNALLHLELSSIKASISWRFVHNLRRTLRRGSRWVRKWVPLKKP